MKYLFLLLCFPASVFGQLIVKGNVADAGSGRCIPYANIGLPGNDAGTVSNEKGGFEFLIAEKDKNEKVLISAAGYKPKLVPADSLNSPKTTIALTPVKSKREIRSSGQKDLTGNFVDKHDLTRRTLLSNPGSEEAALIRNTDTLIIKSFNMRIDSLTYDSLLLRVNFYTEAGAKPVTKINKEDHFFMLQKTNNEIIRVILNEPMIVTEDFFISVELIKSDGDGFVSYATFEDKKMFAYVRPASHGNWKLEKVAAPGFWLEIEK